MKYSTCRMAVSLVLVTLADESMAADDCDNKALQFLESHGYSVAAAMSWCQKSSAPSPAGANDSTPVAQAKNATLIASDAIDKTYTAENLGSTGNSGNNGPANATATIQSSASNYLGDTIKYPYTKSMTRIDMTGTDPANLKSSIVCVPRCTKMSGMGTLTVTDTSTPKSASQAEPGFYVTRLGDSNNSRYPYDYFNFQCRGKDDAALNKEFEEQCPSSGAPMVKVGDVVVIPPDTLSNDPPDRYGWTYGTLTVPYKYHISGSKTFTGSTSLGGYFGFGNSKPGIGLQLVGFLGATTIAVPQSSAGKSQSTTATQTQNLTGVSYGIGLLGNIKGGFHMGLVLGADRVNPDAGYQDNGKAWVAAELGYSFSN